MNARGYVLWVRYGIFSLAILLPLLLPGFVLTLDMVFAPHPPLPTDLTASYPFHAALHFLSFVIPGDILQKIILFVILIFAGVGAQLLARDALLNFATNKHGVARWEGSPAHGTLVSTMGRAPGATGPGHQKVAKLSPLQLATYFAGILYMVNPFVYARFMAGHYAVLLGYALLPFFIRALLIFLEQPSVKNALIAATWATVATIVSVHSLGLMIVATVAALAAAAWRYRKRSKQWLKIIKFGALALGAYITVNSYWLVPLVTGQGSTATAISSFDEVHRQAFATEGGSIMGAIGNIIRLQGFWAESQPFFILPQDILPAWGLIALAMIGLVIAGLVAAIRRARFAAAVFGGSAVAAGFLGIGTTYGWVGTVNLWLTQHLPFFAGYREPHKFVGLLALCYAVMGAFAVHALQRKVKHFALLVLLVPIVLTPTMLWGFIGQLKAAPYPEEWYAMNQRLNSDVKAGKVLSLPWHHYMSYGFAGRVIAEPVTGFFDVPMVVSGNPEFGNLPPDVVDPTAQVVEQIILPGAGQRRDLGEQLAKQDISYVLLAKEFDYKQYDYLNSQADLRLVTEGQSLKLYRNEAYRR